MRKSTSFRRFGRWLISFNLVSLALFGKVVNAGDERVVVHDTERYPYNHIVMVGYDGDKDGDLGAYGSGALVGSSPVFS